MNKADLIKRIKARDAKKPPQKGGEQNRTKSAFSDLAEDIKKEHDSPTKKGIYDLYLIWKTMPRVLKTMSQKMRQDLGFDNEETIDELMAIQSKTEFSKKYGVGRTTLHEWDNRYETKKEMAISKRFMHKMTTRIMMSLATTAIRTGKAAEVMTWMKIIEDYSEKVSIDHSGEIYTLPEERKKRIKELFKRNAHIK